MLARIAQFVCTSHTGLKKISATHPAPRPAFSRCLKALKYKCGTGATYKVVVTDSPATAKTFTGTFTPSCASVVTNCNTWRPDSGATLLLTKSKF